MALHPYQYVPLAGPNQIRIVYLMKDIHARHGLSIRLFERLLASHHKLPFYTFSYTWGLPFHKDPLDLYAQQTPAGSFLHTR